MRYLCLVIVLKFCFVNAGFSQETVLQNAVFMIDSLTDMQSKISEALKNRDKKLDDFFFERVSDTINIGGWEMKPKDEFYIVYEKNNKIGLVFHDEKENESLRTVFFSFIETDLYVFAIVNSMLDLRVSFDLPIFSIAVYSKKMNESFNFNLSIPLDKSMSTMTNADLINFVNSIHELNVNFTSKRVYRINQSACYGISEIYSKNGRYEDVLTLSNSSVVFMQDFSLADLPNLRKKILGKKSLFKGKCTLKGFPYYFDMQALYGSHD